VEQPSEPLPEPTSLSIKTRIASSLGSLRWLFWQGRIMPAFWTVASLISLSINIVLIIILILVGRQLFAIKGLLSGQLLGGLQTNFAQMDGAHIHTTILVSDTIQVNDTVPVIFDLPLNQTTVVKLVEDTPIKRAIVYINGAPVITDLQLPKNTRLNIQLNLSVPVNQMLPVVLNVPVRLTVPVDIPLEQTELHQPFSGLQEVVIPYTQLLSTYPNSWEETPLCTSRAGWLCTWLFSSK
jgi:hypothetical protein